MSAGIVTEEFRTTPHDSRLQVSTLGRVRRLKRRTDRWEFVRPLRSGDGYRAVPVRVNGRWRLMYIHRLVLETFVGPCPPGMQARHIGTNDKTDNRLANLCWGTPAENMADKKDHGTHYVGVDTPHAKVTDADVLEMRRLRLAGVGREELSRLFGLSVTNVSRAVYGANWKHIPPTPEERRRLREICRAEQSASMKAKRLKASLDRIA